MSAAEKSGDSTHRTTGEVYPILLLLPFFLVAALQLLGCAFPSVHTWGFDSWSAFGYAPLFATLLVLLLCAVPAIAKGIQTGLVSLVSIVANSGRTVKAISVTTLSLALGSLFVVFRSQAPIFGDGFGVISNSTFPLSSPLFSIHESLRPVTVMLYRLGCTVMTKQLNLPAQLSFGLVSCVGGVVAFWGLWRLARSLRNKPEEAIALLAAGLASGCTILLFGHLELYVWPTAMMLWLFSYSIDRANGRGSAAPVIVFAILTLSMELMLFPVVLVSVLFRESSAEPRRSLLPFGFSGPTLAWLILACSAICGVLFTVIPGGGAFVPVWPVGEHDYSLFLPSHLLDLANLVVLVALLLLLALIFGFLGRAKQSKFRSGPEQLLAIFTLTLFLVTLWIDPELGAMRDWDLLSFFGFPASIWAGLLLLKRFPGRQAASLLTALSLGLMALTVVPQVIARQNLDKAAARMDKMLWEDPHYQTAYDGALRGVPWAALLQTNTGRYDLAAKYLWRRIGVDSNADICWYNLGEMALNHQQYDSAYVLIGKAYQIAPQSDLYAVRYTEVLQHLNQSDKVEQLLPRIAAITSDNFKLLEYSGLVLVKAGRVDQALRQFRHAYDLRPWDYGALQNMAFDFISLQQSDSAIYYLGRTIRLAPSAGRPNLFRGLLREELKAGRTDEARATLAEYRRQFPEGSGIKEVQQYLDEQK